MQSFIKCEHLYYKYQPEQDWILNDFSIQMNRGEWMAVLGTNGSGKSTFARMLNALLYPNEGAVHIDGYRTTDEETVWEIRQKAGMVFQNPDHQFVAATVRDDIAFGLENAGVERREMVERIEETSIRVGIPHLLEVEPHRLSGGQKQRAAIAGILAREPQIMIFDEATSMLDPKGREEVMRTISELKDAGITIIMITHNLQEAMMSERTVFMEKGKIVRDQPTEEFFADPTFLKERDFILPYFLEMQWALQERGLPLSKLSLNEKEWVSRVCTSLSKM